MNPKLLAPLALSLPALLAIALYLPALGFGYVNVDFSMLVDRPEYHGSLLTVFKSVLNPAGFGSHYYRPLPLLMLGLEQQAFGGQPFASHFVSLALFALNASLLAVLGSVVGRQLGAEGPRALFIGATTGALYALHPVLIESTAWISARFDLLVTSFCLLALIADRCITVTTKRATAVSLLFFAAALSKEMVVGLALALPIWHSMFGTGRPPACATGSVRTSRTARCWSTPASPWPALSISSSGGNCQAMSPAMDGYRTSPGNASPWS